jgi:hypothetical protein
MSEPRLSEIVNGWAAIGDGWAVRGATREEAVRKFREAEERHRRIMARPPPGEWEGRCRECGRPFEDAAP